MRRKSKAKARSHRAIFKSPYRPPLSKVAFDSTRDAYLGHIRALLDARMERCDDDCPGWFVSGDDGDVERCDECASLNGYSHILTDADCGRLPEAIEKREVEWRNEE
jgi:hypothetical protein